MKKRSKILSVITIGCTIMMVACSSGSSSEKLFTENVSTNKPLSLSKDLGLDSIVIIYNATSWANKYKFVIKDSSAILNGTEYKEKRYGEWDLLKDPVGPAVELSDSDKCLLLEYVNKLYVSKTHKIIAKKIKTNEYIEADWPDLNVVLYDNGSKSENAITICETKNGYYLEYSKEFEDFTHRLLILAGKYSYPNSPHLYYRENEYNKDDEDDVFSSCEWMPSFPGGDVALMKYIKDNMIYPPEALKNKIEGKVIVQFVVTKTGKVGKVKVARAVNKELDQEAVRLIKMLPDFSPGRNNVGEPVNVWYTIPITFKLPDNN